MANIGFLCILDSIQGFRTNTNNQFCHYEKAYLYKYIQDNEIKYC